MTTSTLLMIQPEDIQRRNLIGRVLLAMSAIFMLVNFLALRLQNIGGANQWAHLLAWGACAVGGTWVLERKLPKRDPLLFPIVMLLSGWGLILIDRLAPIFADRQTVWLVISVIGLLITANLPHLLRGLRQYRYLLLIFGLVLLVSTILLGRNPSGLQGAPELWLGIGNIFFQPSEALKIILVAFLASYLAEQYPAMRIKNRQNTWLSQQIWLSPRILGPILLMWGLCVVVLVWQRDLGTAALFFIVFLLLLYVATEQTLILISGFVLIGVAGFVAYHLFAVVQLRVDIWLNPWAEADGRAYQIVQSLMAFANGGIFGQGVGQGSPTYIPVVHSDFVFAALAEEWGLLGVVILIACLAVFTLRGLRIANLHQPRPFNALLAIGLTLLIAVQSLMIMGGVLKLFPLTGVTLPFLSYGGSSLLMSFIVTGLLLRLSSEVNS
jgi:cell division protein FtsW (lipid II flippase)